MADECARLQRNFENSKQLGQQLIQYLSAISFLMLVCLHRLLSTTFGLAILLVATLATVGNFPSVENSTMSSFVAMTKRRMKPVSRSMSASSG